MATYYIAKANQTARAFVVRAENLNPAWIILAESNSYTKACIARDAINAGNAQ